MKRLMIIATLLVFSTGMAQDETTEKAEETRTTTVKVKTKDGEKTVKRKEKIKARQDIELDNADEQKVNYNVKRKPFVIEHETSYSAGNENYSFTPDKRGFNVNKENRRNNKMEPFARARRTTPDGYYIMTSDDNQRTSFGYFDNEGNFISERYDPKSDKVIKETYTRSQSNNR